MAQLTAGEECQLSAKILSAFADPRQGAITAPFINSAMGLAVFKGDIGVAVVRLKSGDWSAPCAITCKGQGGGAVQPAQEMVLLFMSENSIFSLVGQTSFIFNQTHKFAPGPLYGNALNLDSSVDVYCFVRFNNGFTPSELISQHMIGWSVNEDPIRHSKWHGKNATWFDVLTNKISVDRSSVGNALYLVLNLASSGGNATGKNFAAIDDWAKSRPTSDTTINQSFQQQQQPHGQQNNYSNFQQQLPSQMSNYSNQSIQQQDGGGFDAQALYQMQLNAQEQMQRQMMQHQGLNNMNNSYNMAMMQQGYQQQQQYQHPQFQQNMSFQQQPQTMMTMQQFPQQGMQMQMNNPLNNQQQQQFFNGNPNQQQYQNQPNNGRQF